MTIKKLAILEIDNRTNVKVNNSYYLEVEKQDYYKNGKPKGRPSTVYDYYFFNNDEANKKFLEKYKDLKKYDSIIVLAIGEGLRYNEDFVLKNLNKI